MTISGATDEARSQRSVPVVAAGMAAEGARCESGVGGERSRLETDSLDRRRSAQSYFDAGLPWTGEFEDLVNEGLVDVS